MDHHQGVYRGLFVFFKEIIDVFKARLELSSWIGAILVPVQRVHTRTLWVYCLEIPVAGLRWRE